jgi:hypothetical protein
MFKATDYSSSRDGPTTTSWRNLHARVPSNVRIEVVGVAVQREARIHSDELIDGVRDAVFVLDTVNRELQSR